MTERSCRNCGAPDPTIVFDKPDTYFWHGAITEHLPESLVGQTLSARVYGCAACGYVGVPLDPRLAEMLDRYYTSPCSMPGTTHGKDSPIAQARTAEFFDLLDRLGAPKAPARVLEVGCQQGFLLAEFLRRGSQRVVGVEPADVPPLTDDTGTPLDVRLSYLTAEAIDGETFDFAFALQVMEHIDDPHAFLGILHRAVAPGGFLMLAVPHDLLAMELGYPGAFIFQHLSLFTPRSLCALLARNGFATVATLAEPDLPLCVLARRESGPLAVESDAAAVAEEGPALAARFARAVDQRLAWLRAEVAKGPPGRVALWGANVAACNAFSWAPDLRESGVRVFDGDPAKVGLPFGGIPGTIEGVDAAGDIERILVAPLSQQERIVAALKGNPLVRADILRMFPEIAS